MAIRNVRAMPPQPCANNEIDVSWDNDPNGVWMAVDQVLMVNGKPITPPNHVQLPGNQTQIRISTFTQPLHDKSVVPGNTYTYNVRNFDRNKRLIAGGESNPVTAGVCSFLESTAFIQKYPDTFEVLVPRGAVINDYTHEAGTILQGDWKHVHQLKPPSGNPSVEAKSVNLIQGISGELEAISRLSTAGEGDFLVAYELDPQTDWQGPVNLLTDNRPIDHVTGSIAFIQSTYDNQGHFELLVPRGAVIEHYIHEMGSILKDQWTHVHTLKPPADDAQAQFKAVTIIQSSSGTLVAIARLSPAAGAGGDYLVAYELEPAPGSVNGSGSEAEVVSESESITVSTSEVAEVVSVTETVTVSISESVASPESVPYSASEWQGPVKLTADSGPIDHVSGSSAIVQSSQGTFELLVPRGAVIDQYTHEEATVLKGTWKHVQTLKSPDNNAQITANWLIQSRSGKLEAVARVSPPSGGRDDYLVGYESDPGAQWQGPVKLVADDGPILAGEPHVVIE